MGLKFPFQSKSWMWSTRVLLKSTELNLMLLDVWRTVVTRILLLLVSYNWKCTPINHKALILYFTLIYVIIKSCVTSACPSPSSHRTERLSHFATTTVLMLVWELRGEWSMCERQEKWCVSLDSGCMRIWKYKEKLGLVEVCATSFILYIQE